VSERKVLFIVQRRKIKTSSKTGKLVKARLKIRRKPRSTGRRCGELQGLGGAIKKKCQGPGWETEGGYSEKREFRKGAISTGGQLVDGKGVRNKKKRQPVG